jgi:energy-coupling factor transporter ATP-binding protein EcfA2
VHDELEIGEAQPLRCLQRGLWLFTREERRYALLLDVSDSMRRSGVRVEIAALAEGQKAAEAMLASVRATAESAETYRGKVLAPSEEEYAFDEGPVTLRVVRCKPVDRGEIVLAAGLLELIERNTLGFAACCEQLARLGMAAQKGVLLHGPPGTGKTLLVRYLTGALPGHTKFILSADKLSWLADTIEAARLLAPAMVVIEDVDLIAAHRDGPWQQTPTALDRLLNEMDGVGADARLIFVFTTNRPEVLEPALAARPGRVDQAIEIGLPEDRERRVLLRRHACGLPIDEETVARISLRVGRVSPAFIKELARRAAQVMVERGGERLDDADFERAFEDMSGTSSKITARLLGAKGAGFVTT